MDGKYQLELQRTVARSACLDELLALVLLVGKIWKMDLKFGNGIVNCKFEFEFGFVFCNGILILILIMIDVMVFEYGF